MLVILHDPKVTSVLPKAFNEKGYRILQGEKLRKMLLRLIQTEVKKSQAMKTICLRNVPNFIPLTLRALPI